MVKPEGLQVSDSEWQQVNAILQRYLPQYEVWAFGSRVKGNAKPYSDLDLAIISDTPLPLALLASGHYSMCLKLILGTRIIQNLSLMYDLNGLY